MGYSNFLFLKEELSLIAVMLILLVYDLFGSQKSLKYFHPVACVLFLVHTLLNLFPAGTAEAFGGMYVCTPIGSIVKTILNTGTLIVLLQAYNWVNSESVLIRRGEFYLILFSSLLGMYFMISAGNFLLFFIGLETASIPMAVLSAFDKYKHQSAEAGAKYILSAHFILPTYRQEFQGIRSNIWPSDFLSWDCFLRFHWCLSTNGHPTFMKVHRLR